MDFISKNAKWIGLCGCLLAIIGCFLPYASVYGVSIKFASKGVNVAVTDGYIVLVLFIVSIALMLCHKEKWSVIPSALGLFVSLFDGINVKNTVSIANLEIGFYVILIGSIVAIILPFFIRKESKKKGV